MPLRETPGPLRVCPIGASMAVSFDRGGRTHGLSALRSLHLARLPAWLVVVLVCSSIGGCSLLPSFGDRAGGAPPEGHFVWPAEGRISSLFGPRNGTNHDGIDIAAPEGTPVRCAASGEVLYSGVLRGYGRTVIIAHGYGLTSVYAHQREVFVRKGARVDRGTVIGSVGRTGRVTGPNLHFEIRRDNVARDPLRYLPSRPPAVLAGNAPLTIGG